jgi:lipopolysaccharide transport system ATP-binding protein
MQRAGEPVIKVCGISKRYSLGSALAERTLKDALGSTVSKLATALRSPRNLGSREAREFWALRDVSFQVAAGEVVGIVGNNGAGKSTLLKILSRITEPTKGIVTYTGRVGSLLEVGTGFHPELSGRDNIFLNGAILGIRRRDIARHFDEIVAFAGIEPFIDTPVKRYSSGMYLRLAFAVSAYLDTDILLVDEVLAVGDVNFQQKCLARMHDVSRGGRTILFVSHNLTAIRALCKRTLLLDSGRLLADGETNQVLSDYLRNSNAANGVGTIRQWSKDNAPVCDAVQMISASAKPVGGTPMDPIYVTSSFLVEGFFRNLKPGALVSMSITLHDQQGLLLFDTGSSDPPIRLPIGLYRSRCEIPGNLLNNGNYFIGLAFRERGEVLLELPRVIQFQVADTEDNRAGWYGKWPGVLRPQFRWTTEAMDTGEHSESSPGLQGTIGSPNNAARS